MSSRAIHGGAYFSDVSGWNSIPISVPGPCEVTEWHGLLGFCLTITFLQCITFTIDQCTVSRRFDRISQQSAKMDFSSMILSISYEHLSIMMMIMLPSLDCPQYLHVIPNSPKNEHLEWISQKRPIKISHRLNFTLLLNSSSMTGCWDHIRYKVGG